MRKYLIILAGLVASLALFSGSALATNGMNVIGVGPVARSMGGATTGLPLDASTVLTNPAGMSQVEGRIDFGVTMFSPHSEYSALDYSGGQPMNTGSKTSDTPASPMPAFGLIIPISDQFKFGLGAYGQAGMGVDYPYGGYGLYGNVVYTNFQMMKFAPGISYQVNKYLSLGAAVNFDYATMAFNAGRSMTTGEIVSHDSNSQFGYGFELGVLVTPVDWLQIGLAYTSKQWFDDFTFNTVYGRDKLDFDLPQTVALGIGLKLHPRFKLAFDVKWINWDDTMGPGKPQWSQVPSGSGAWNVSWDNQWVFAVGAEFAVTDAFRLRAGFNYAANPLKENRAFENIAFPALAETHFTAGFGWSISDNVELNLGGMYAPEVTLSGQNLAQQGIGAYETSLSEFSVDLGLTYKF